MRKGRSRAAFTALATCAGIALASPATGQHRHEPPARGSLADTIATAPTTPRRSVKDSARVADSVLRACGPHAAHSIVAYSGCVGTAISALSAAGNVALAMGTLDAVVNGDTSLVRLGHPLAHALGYAVRSTPRTASLLLAQCDERYQSGCYHGILQRYFDARIGMPLADEVLKAPCEPFRGTAEQFRLFDCLHGTGHGLMMYHRYDIRAALVECDRLGSEWDRSSCHGGVFMEHNMGVRMQAIGNGEAGMHRHSTPTAEITLFKPGDLHYPCNATPERYRRECYSLQTDLILPAVKQDYAKAAKVCDAAGALPLVRACYAGLGRNASGAAVFAFDGIRRRCDTSSEWGKPYCYEGAVRHLAYAPSELPRGIAFCKTLPAGAVRSRCWGGLGLQIAGFYADLAPRRKACESEFRADVAACAHGAGVPGSEQEPPTRTDG